MNITPDFAAEIVEKALGAGATAAEVVVNESVEFSVGVRLGDIETLQESASKGLGLRVLCSGRQASVSTSDFSSEGIADLVATAVGLAQATSTDDTAGLPAETDLAVSSPDLDLFDDAIPALNPETKIKMALDAEAAARAVDARIVNFDRGGLDTRHGRTILANSLGFAGEYRGTSISLMTVPIAGENGLLQREYWFDSRRALAQMESPEFIGRKAASRTLGRLGARRVKTQVVPVVFDSMTAGSFLGYLFGAVSGDAIFRKSSFLVDKLGDPVAAVNLTVIDDGTLPGRAGSRPFDGEGVATRRTTVIENGVLATFLHNSYTARKLGDRTTGNASRGLTGAPSVGPNNFFVEPGPYSHEEIVKTVQNGFLVTDLIGFGVNPVNGDYSQGAAGVWIENGEPTFPVEEVTIAGNLKEMLFDIEMIGNDLDFRSRVSAPTLKLSKMTVSGE